VTRRVSSSLSLELLPRVDVDRSTGAPSLWPGEPPRRPPGLRPRSSPHTLVGRCPVGLHRLRPRRRARRGPALCRRPAQAMSAGSLEHREQVPPTSAPVSPSSMGTSSKAQAHVADRPSRHPLLGAGTGAPDAGLDPVCLRSLHLLPHDYLAGEASRPARATGLPRVFQRLHRLRRQRHPRPGPADPECPPLRLRLRDPGSRARVSRGEALLAPVRESRDLLPICSYCKKIRNDQNSWEQMESYISEHFHATFSHVLCPDCRSTVVARDLEKWRSER
jgi:hypothetical protein